MSRDDGLTRTPDGDLVPAADDYTPHSERCHKGWLGYDLDGALIPCTVCKPHLIPYLQRRRAQKEH